MKKKILILGLLLPFLLPATLLILIAGNLFDDTTTSQNGQETSLTAKEVANKANISEERAKDVIQILNYQLSHEGFSLAGSAGSLAVAERESGFDPKAINTSGGVAGYFQWSGWSSSVNGNRWASAPQRALESQVELKLMSTELSGAYANVKSKMQSASDAGEASLYWSEHYEGVALSDGQTKADQLKVNARKWYNIFNGTLKNSKTTIAFSGNTGLSKGTLLSSFDFPSEYNGKLKYGQPSSKSVTTQGGNSYPTGQCTWYVCNRLIETGICTDPAIYNNNGNGQDWVSALVSKGWKQSNSPQVGAVMSVKGGYGETLAQYGHVAFVEAVNKDGTFLISECNYNHIQDKPHYQVLSPQSYYSFAVK